MISVLLADDSELMRKVIAHLLKDNPEIQVVAVAESFSQTIHLANKLHPQIVVMDLYMGDENVVSPSQVKAWLGSSQLLAISIWNDDETKALANCFGAVAFLNKKDLDTQLIPAIKKYARAKD